MRYFILILVLGINLLNVHANPQNADEIIDIIETKFQNLYPSQTLGVKNQWFEGMALTRDKYHTLINHQSIKGLEDRDFVLRVLIGCTSKVKEQKELMNSARPILEQLKMQPLRSRLTSPELMVLWYMHQGDLSPKSNNRIYQEVIDLCALIAQSSVKKAFYWRQIWEQLNDREKTIDLTKDFLKAWHHLPEEKALALGRQMKPSTFVAVKPLYLVSLIEQYKYGTIDLLEQHSTE